MTETKLYGGIEGGGTKFVCVVASGPDHIEAETRFPTTTPAETLAHTMAFFEPFVRRAQLTALGFASFGPVDLRPDSSTYGYITTTPKPGWAHSDMIGDLKREFNLPVAFDLDVNAAAFGEYYWVPENRQHDPLVYFTIGTGIGAGIVVNGRLLHGLVHPEAGHMRIPHDLQNDPYPGHCPFHQDCFEGLACGPAMNARWKQSAETLPSEHPAWDLEASYIASAMNNVVCMLSPKRIVLGGGVMGQPNLLPLVRRKMAEYLNGYIQHPVILAGLDDFLVLPKLGSRSGVLGAVALASLISE